MSEGKVYKIKIIGPNAEDTLEMTLSNEADKDEWKDAFKAIRKWTERY